MISVEQAKKIILSTQLQSPTEMLALLECNKRVLAEDVVSPCDMPLFDASAMDGYAFSYAEGLLDYSVIAESIAAGHVGKTKILPGEAVRIMTGAALPLGVDSVIPQECTTLLGNQLHFTKPIFQGENVRKRAEEICKGAITLPAQTLLNANSISYLAGLGITHLPVHANPRVCIIPTGSELIKPGTPLKPGQIYESTSIGLKLALLELGISAEVTEIIPDDPIALSTILSEKLKTSTHILLCGGVSVGDFDFNKSVLADCGVATTFWKVTQKPGKPLYYGQTQDCRVFGMPGNPVSSMICYYEYVRAALCKYQGQDEDLCKLSTQAATLVTPIQKKSGMTHFIRAKLQFSNNTLYAEVLGKQGSHMLSGLSKANGLIVVPSEATQIQTGESVTIHWLP